MRRTVRAPAALWLRGATILVLCAAGAPRAWGQRVLLEIRPHVGDTLHMRLDQEMDMTAGAGRSGEPTTVTTTWCVLQRIVVERADSSGSDVLQMTDSVATASVGAALLEPPRRPRPSVEGSEVRLHVAPDGAITVLDSANHVHTALREMLAHLPVTFPRTPVKVGHTWVRTMKLPAGAGYDAGDDIKLEFRLDSLSAGKDSAYVSVRGPLGKPRVGPTVGGGTVTTLGSLTGTMLIDRHRGWLTDWHAQIAVEYVMQPPRGAVVSGQSRATAMRMTATQWLRAVDRP